MALKGTATKAIIQKKILETFPGSFLYNDGKEIRITMQEDGADVQIKVALTAAKTPVSADGEEFAVNPAQEAGIEFGTPAPAPTAQMTEEENQTILKMAEFIKTF